MTTLVAITAHDTPDRPPLRLAVGDRVSVGERAIVWPEFVFVTAAHGSGWVPGRYLTADVGPAEVLVAYDTTELPTEVGEVVLLLEEDQPSGWVWCRNRSGREGWIPVNSLRPHTAADGPVPEHRPEG